MKKIKMLLLFMILMFPIYVFASGSVNLSKTTLSVSKGGTATFVISANNAGGKLTVSSSDTSVATVDKDSVWVENDGDSANTTVTVTVTGVSTGTADINIELTDVATFDEEELTGTKKVSVTVTDGGSTTASSKLTDLKVDGVTVSGFSPTKTSYSLTTDKSSVSISATKEDSSASVTGTGTKSLTYGVNTVNVKVTAGSSSTTYVLSITRSDDRDGDIYLKELSLGDVELPFDKNMYEYEIEVDNAIDSVTITASAESDKSTVSGTGAKSLQVGSNVFNVRVIAENGNAKVYKLTITRLEKGDGGDAPIDIDPTGTMFTITYNSNGGKACSPKTKKVLIDTALGVLCTPTRKGYEFDGWYTSKTGGIKVTSETLATASITIYARWIENPKTGISTPVIALFAVALLSIVAFLVVRKQKNKASL